MAAELGEFGIDVDITSLSRMTQTQVCAALALQPQADGTFARHEGKNNLCLLPLGEILPWQKADRKMMIAFLAGAPLALSWSPDGQNAAAVHLGEGVPHRQTHQKTHEAMAANTWLTAESLGQWSLIMLSYDALAPHITRAPADWFPTPMAAPQGEA